VVTSPPIAAGTRDAMTTKMHSAFANIGRFFQSEALANEVAL